MSKCTKCGTAFPAEEGGSACRYCLVDGLTDALDLHRDDFKRIRALFTPPTNGLETEVAGICDRAIQNIEQTVPVVVQRDRLEADNGRLRRMLQMCEHALLSYQHGNISTKLAEEIADKVQEALKL